MPQGAQEKRQEVQEEKLQEVPEENGQEARQEANGQEVQEAKWQEARQAAAVQELANTGLQRQNPQQARQVGLRTAVKKLWGGR
jgi:hypothetical protein